MALLRSSLWSLVVACFLSSTLTQGSMPGCGNHASPAHGHHGHGAASSSVQPVETPAHRHCLTHVCCIQIVSSSPTSYPASRLVAAPASSGALTARLFVPVRPPQLLPFAQPPPPTTA